LILTGSSNNQLKEIKKSISLWPMVVALSNRGLNKLYQVVWKSRLSSESCSAGGGNRTDT
jgi:hypothetical protein